MFEFFKEIARNWCISKHKKPHWEARENGGQKCKKCGRVWRGTWGARGIGGRVV